jgi:hypothetical protein
VFQRQRLIALALAAALAPAGGAVAQDALSSALLDSLEASRVDTAAVDSAAAAAPDSVPAALDVPRVRDFFDTGVSGTACVLMTPVFPGWGQLYSGGGWRAMLAFGAQWFFWSNMLAADRDGVRYRDHAQTLSRTIEGSPNFVRAQWDALSDERFEVFRDFAWWSGGILLLVTVDAYVGAGLYNFDEEPVPVPDRFDQYFPEADNPVPVGSSGAPSHVVAQWGWRF